MRRRDATGAGKPLPFVNPNERFQSKNPRRVQRSCGTMSYFGHTLLIILYAAAATAAAKYVPERLPEFSDGIPVAIGAFTLFVLMLVRAAYLTTEFRIRTGRELKRMRAQYDDVLRELGFARAE